LIIGFLSFDICGSIEEQFGGGITIDFSVFELTNMDVLEYRRNLGPFYCQSDFETATPGKSGVAFFYQNPLNRTN